MVTPNGDLIDPTKCVKSVLEPRIMTRQLYEGLKHQRVTFDEDYTKWSKSVMIKKICTVMGIPINAQGVFDPDETYVLTVDNLIKILAIQMRFRYT